MKEEYVTYEQAVKLKELGFDWETYDYYYGKNRKFHQSIPLDHNGNDGGRKECCSAPRLDQAAAWLREEKGIFVGVTYDNNMSNYNPYGFRVQIPMCNDRSALGFHEYNHALSAGIDAALRLLTDKLNSLQDKE